MKKLIIINGTMGVGKTTVSKKVHKSLEDPSGSMGTGAG